MPWGVICDAAALALGGLLGALAGDRLSAQFKKNLNMVFSVCAMSIGIKSVVLLENLPAVVLAIILGTIMGMAVGLGARVRRGGMALQRLFARVSGADGGDAAQAGLMVTAIVLFCFSGTGIYGAIVSGISGDHSILIAKSILDLFTALIFACTLGASVSAIALPQLLLFLALYACAKLIDPLTTPTMVSDFKACGGVIMLATGLRMAKVDDFPIADMIPAMVLVWPLSWLWTTAIAPLLA